MRSSIITLAALASVAVASPIGKLLHDLNKRAIIWNYVTETVLVTVTDGVPMATSIEDTATTTHVHRTRTHFHNPDPSTTSTTSVVIPETTSVPTPEVVAPTTTEAPVVQAPATTEEAPAPSTTEVPATTEAAPQTTEAPVPATTEAAPIVASTTAAEAIPAVVNNVVAVADVLPTDVASAGVYYHNKHRANHTAADVTWDANLAKYAQVLADTCNFHHDQ